MDEVANQDLLAGAVNEWMKLPIKIYSLEQ
jgi:hypothetical protein